MVAGLALCAVLGVVVETQVGGSTRPPTNFRTARPESNIVSGQSTQSGFDFYAATVRVPTVVVRALPDASAPARVVLGGHNENGVPQTFLVKGGQRGPDGGRWYRVLLPIRPNGSTGWVQSSDVEVTGIDYQIVIHLRAFRLDLFEGRQLRRSMPIGVGTDQTPTPGGEYYIKELLKPPDPNTVYGDYVFGLSGFSNVLTSWPQGGVLGIHGTNDPAHSIGHQVSHGCIRLTNQDIDQLAGLLPLGTPLEVEP